MTSRDYLFVVDEELSDGAARAFEGMRVHRDDGTTTIEGPCRDQAELLGTVLRISELGLTLLSFAAKDSVAAPPPDPRPTKTSLPMARPHDAFALRRTDIASSRETAHGQQA